ncbi:ferric-dicitrate binding protein FerR (iron transport regulator) [Mucilaginibacter lappiensis]|uniref:Ferric-dicitrate binding protein FerR (Iron transport regulator) n=1 Tax=Mucilaginibacter lappiensis TaxID=354630 RepID=A0ABR6PG20_9SPHI|nr:FecR domain-containing protein [Mucilaginibacter lappiensis]MBB6108715.1 ferric-dicitrate binding protein FerR (iron transport regulator) [Mucilaginibacter lappiensis]
MKDQIYIASLFKKYLDVQCTPAEIKELFYLINRKENEGFFTSLIAQELTNVDTEPLSYSSEELAISKVKSVLISEIRSQIPQKPAIHKYPYKLDNTWLKIAALWLIMGSSTLFLFYRHFTDRYNAQIKNSTKQLVTINGERKFIRLFDGTKIWLSPSSTIKYNDQLVNNYREVTLDGEAFFEVAKDKKHPFIIHSGRMQTQVVGTSFNVKSYSKQNIYNVTVVTGIVKVSMLSAKKEKLSEVILKPKQEAIYNNAHATLADKSIKTVDAVIKKKNGILSYDGTPVPEVVSDFKRYYNQSIELENKSATCLCYGDFDTTKPIDIVLRQLAAAIGATVRQTDNGYFFEGGCSDK